MLLLLLLLLLLLPDMACKTHPGLEILGFLVFFVRESRILTRTHTSRALHRLSSTLLACLDTALPVAPRLLFHRRVGVRTMLRRTPLTKIDPALVCERAAAAATESGADHTTVLLDDVRRGAFFVHDDAGIASPPERTAGSCPGHCAMVRSVAEGGMVAVSFSWSRPERRRDVEALFRLRNTRSAPATEARGASAAVPGLESLPVVGET